MTVGAGGTPAVHPARGQRFEAAIVHDEVLNTPSGDSDGSNSEPAGSKLDPGSGVLGQIWVEY
jgi:hypothetical protein